MKIKKKKEKKEAKCIMTLGLEFELPPTMISFSYEYLVILAFTRTLKILINNHPFDMGFGN